MYDKVREINENSLIVNEGYRLISKMIYSKVDTKDIWLGYELGKVSLGSQCFDIKGKFENGSRM